MQLIKRLRLLLVLLVGLPVALGDASPRDVAALVRAKNLLGTESWSAVLQLATTRPGRPSENALVFEFADALWFYRPIDGTRSLSRHWNNVPADREQLLELLQRIDPTYQSYRFYSDDELLAAPPSRGTLRNGCFIESAAEARRLRREGRVVESCLLSYYVKTASGLKGHTVLCYKTLRYPPLRSGRRAAPESEVVLGARSSHGLGPLGDAHGIDGRSGQGGQDHGADDLVTPLAATVRKRLTARSAEIAKNGRINFPKRETRNPEPTRSQRSQRQKRALRAQRFGRGNRKERRDRKEWQDRPSKRETLNPKLETQNPKPTRSQREA
ncbi:MAG: hypothetical protein IPL39_14740 [Opitutaceae bacterium]|nr:hypothetical protein [Opitutaceae bacterium]